jgi:signal transduction histidine kinase
MSLRSYLFSLIGGLIILLTISQLFLVRWIEKNLAEEVNIQAKFFSEQVIELAFEEFDQASKTNKVLRHKVIRESSSPHESFRSEEEIAKIIQDIAPNIEFIEENSATIADLKTHVTKLPKVELAINQENVIETVADTKNQKAFSAAQTSTQKESHNIREKSSERHLIEQELKSLVEKIHNDNKATLTDNNDVAIFVRSPEVTNEHWLEHEVEVPVSETSKLINYIQWVLIICGLFALVIAYWLSAKFNKPLKNLSLGFKQLAIGDYSHQVAEGGVNEIRETIVHFNDMVNHLSELTQAAKHHSEIAHLAELGEVSRGLAHALRNPIHTIGLSIEQLSEDELSKQQRQSLIRTVQNKITHIDRNIKALLTLTTTGISRQDKIPLLAVVQDIVLEYKSCQNKPQQFAINVDPNIELLGAESEIRSIFHTLIYNACDANTINGIVTITVKKQEKECVTLYVSDEGKGLIKSVENKLFQPHISTKPEGAGMGLYIANRIISLHYQGKLTLVNADDIGCIATAYFNFKEHS